MKFYGGMQSALTEGTIDENDVVHFVEICYCLEGGLYPMAIEIPVLKENFEDVIDVMDREWVMIGAVFSTICPR